MALDRFVLFRLGIAGGQPTSQKDRHGLVEKAGAGIEEQRLRPFGRAISRLLQQLALGAGQGLLAGIDAAGGKFPESVVSRITVLSLQKNERFGTAIVDRENYS